MARKAKVSELDSLPCSMMVEGPFKLDLKLAGKTPKKKVDKNEWKKYLPYVQADLKLAEEVRLRMEHNS